MYVELLHMIIIEISLHLFQMLVSSNVINLFVNETRYAVAELGPSSVSSM